MNNTNNIKNTITHASPNTRTNSNTNPNPNINPNFNVNLFFYSPKCEVCINLMKLMKNEGILDNFKLVNVQEMKVIPKNIQRVPTLRVVEIPKLISGRETFIWLQSVKILRQKNISEQNNKKIFEITKSMQQMNNSSKDTPKGFACEEMSGFSDKFSYNETDMAQAKTFFMYGTEADNIILTGEEIKRKINKAECDREIKKLEDQRNMQDKEYAVIMKQSQVRQILRSNNLK